MGKNRILKSKYVGGAMMIGFTAGLLFYDGLFSMLIGIMAGFILGLIIELIIGKK